MLPSNQQTTTGSSPDILLSLFRRKWIALIAVLIGATAGALIAAFTDRAWRSEAQLVVVKGDEESGSLGGLGSELGGISALAGISLPTDSARSEYIATLKSTGLAREFIRKGTVALDFCKANIITCSDPSSWKDGPPEELLYRMVRKFQRSVMDVQEDKLTGIIRVSMTWVDRVIAAQWVNGIVAAANNQLQRRAIEDAHRRLDYLRDTVTKTDLVPLRDAVSRLMEGQVKTAMMAETRPDYAFRVVDEGRPAAQYDYVKPRRAVMIAFGGVLGFLAVALWTLLKPPRALPN
jgi:uncharacterized protein involved in exopolysaccharide biosynthesis